MTAGATEATAKPRENEISIGILKTPSPIKAFVVASHNKGMNVINTTRIPLPVNVIFIPPLVSSIPKQHVLIHYAQRELYGYTISPKKFLATHPIVIIAIIGGI